MSFLAFTGCLAWEHWCCKCYLYVGKAFVIVIFVIKLLKSVSPPEGTFPHYLEFWAVNNF